MAKPVVSFGLVLKVLSMVVLLFITSTWSSPVGVNNFVAGPPLTDEEFSSAPPIIIKTRNPIEMAFLYQNDIKFNAERGIRNAINEDFLRWPDAQIPYVISSDYDDNQRRIIAIAINEYHTNTCIRFVPWTNESDYIIILKSGEGCWSYLGRIGGGQEVSLDDGCVAFIETVQHELMHAAGFDHEQSRYDRDEYVIINWDNIIPGYEDQFRKNPINEILLLGTLYNTESIMHYSSYGFWNGNGPTITRIDGTLISGPLVFTQEDIIKLNRMYNCDPTDCWDDDPLNLQYCDQQVAAGQCQSNAVEMEKRCKKSCNFC